ncbi:MAG: glycosyltransferase [Pseudomonadota bacterium]
MTAPAVSVVIVSRHRAALLRRCLLGVSQQLYAPFEIVVVADPAGLKAAQSLIFAQDLKLIAFDQPNIAVARNLGIEQAAGDIIAFIDDDAVPEPTWLKFLTAPAERPEVAAMGGFVRGRNGISWQWRGHRLDAFGAPHPVEVGEGAFQVLWPKNDGAIKTEGTNMAFRRALLVELGGFDPAFSYFLDETDINMRLAAAGYATALVPKAEVHHGFAPNRMRNQARVPTDLFEIGASWAVFQRKHVPSDARLRQWQGIYAAQRARLLKHMVQGGLEPFTVRKLLSRLEMGYAEGQARELIGHNLKEKPFGSFRLSRTLPSASRFLVTTPRNLTSTLAQAAENRSKGEIVTILSLSMTALFHHTAYHNQGVWLQQGGTYGRSERSDPIVTWSTRAERASRERQRVALQRAITSE